MKTERPFISVITVTYNAVNSIEQTITSVIKQMSEEIEYIIIDGNSTDGTKDVISKYKNQLSHYISEKDEGIYDAMNKGVSITSGHYIYFINAGDICYTLPVQILKEHTADIICFPVQLKKDQIFYPQINASIKIRNTLPHQGCFYKNQTALQYDTTYKVFADFALNQTYYKHNKKIVVLQQPVVAFHDEGGISHNPKYKNEIFKIVLNHAGWLYLIKSYLYFKVAGLKSRFTKNAAY